MISADEICCAAEILMTSQIDTKLRCWDSSDWCSAKTVGVPSQVFQTLSWSNPFYGSILWPTSL
jgi:hypothetical protein